MLILFVHFGHTDVEQRFTMLKTELKIAREEVKVNAELFRREQDSRKAAQSRLTKVEGGLGNCIKEFELSRSRKESLATEAKQLGLDLKEARIQSSSAEEELKQASDIAVGKPYLL